MTLVAHKTSQSPKTQVAKTLIDTFKEPDRNIRKGCLNVSTINGLMFQLFLVIKVDLWGILNASQSLQVLKCLLFKNNLE
ncbi:hypothetical protein ACRRTK_018432 [Alexandromys fortis]